ncbi:MAG: flagellar protein FlgN [Shewanella sp.]|nr:flagellar protein FlgN [Shewanella sp.]MCF1429787.1 flagellar protein FlgN [Shewanella sp.]MCF1438685.1 flagellar protein FlgN [Shewanella sp.]MCF1457020.1 flagellar protein FlgN [Shewanella sp.]
MTTDISALLDSQRQTLTKLHEVISDEKQALSQQQAESLLALAQQKQSLLQQLQQFDTQLSSHPEKARLTTDLASAVADIKDALAHCQLANEANARLIEMNLASINRLASALQASRNASSLTYDGKGKTSTIPTLGNNLKV